jgi:hypothetical protein
MLDRHFPAAGTLCCAPGYGHSDDKAWSLLLHLLQLRTAEWNCLLQSSKCVLQKLGVTLGTVLNYSVNDVKAH